MQFYDISEFKYLLAHDEVIPLPDWPFGAWEVKPYLTCTQDGTHVIRAGYPWDGPSGPTRDRKTNIPGSLPHDTLYEGIRAGVIPYKEGRKYADNLLKNHLKKSGMRGWWAKYYYYKGLRWFGAYAAKRRKSKKYYVKYLPSPWKRGGQ